MFESSVRWNDVGNGCFYNLLMQQNIFGFHGSLDLTATQTHASVPESSSGGVSSVCSECTDWLGLIVRGCQALGESTACLCSVCTPDSFAEIRARLLFVFGSHGCVCTHWWLTSEREGCTEESFKWIRLTSRPYIEQLRH